VVSVCGCVIAKVHAGVDVDVDIDIDVDVDVDVRE